MKLLIFHEGDETGAIELASVDLALEKSTCNA